MFNCPVWAGTRSKKIRMSRRLFVLSPIVASNKKKKKKKLLARNTTKIRTKVPVVLEI